MDRLLLRTLRVKSRSVANGLFILCRVLLNLFHLSITQVVVRIFCCALLHRVQVPAKKRKYAFWGALYVVEPFGAKRLREGLINSRTIVISMQRAVGLYPPRKGPPPLIAETQSLTLQTVGVDFCPKLSIKLIRSNHSMPSHFRSLRSCRKTG